ncbi:hypothetical protein Q1695_012754 [Nippostrongylus brasiliensis]|nr:hypothetical protein Q1695_012754 [Nippostrongylus brasiliensis]
MRTLEWDVMGVKIDGRQLHHLRFTDGIVLITPSITQAERMLADIDHACGKIGLQLNLTKTMFMRNGYVSDAPFSLNGTNISECSSYVYLGREVNMTNDLSPELGRRKRASWGAFKSVEEVVRRTKNARLRAHLFDSTVLPALTYASESWALRKQDEHAICVAQRSIERRMLGVTRFIQARDGIRSSELRRQPKIRDAVAWAKLSKIRSLTFALVGLLRQISERPIRCPSCFSSEQDPLVYHGTRQGRMDWIQIYWRPLEQIDDQRDDI